MRERLRCFWYTQTSVCICPFKPGLGDDQHAASIVLFGEWLSLVEHLVRDQGVGGSNPLSPTNSFQSFTGSKNQPGAEGFTRMVYIDLTRGFVLVGDRLEFFPDAETRLHTTQILRSREHQAWHTGTSSVHPGGGRERARGCLTAALGEGTEPIYV